MIEFTATTMEFISDTQRLLSNVWGVDVLLRGVTSIARRGRAETWRASVDTSGSGPILGSVIIKQAIVESDCFFEECAGLQFINGLHTAPNVAPKFLACDLNTRLLVMEDLGPGQSLENLSSSDDVEANALTNLAVVTAHLHAAAVGLEADYDVIREKISSLSRTPVRIIQASSWRDGLQHVKSVLNTLEIEPSHELDHEWESVAQVVEDPGPFLTYTHGDMAPSNNHFVTAGAYLLDFEYGGYRHALYDALYWHTIYPFPQATILKADVAYRNALAGTIPEIGDDAAYAAALTHMCAHHAFSFVRWWLPGILHEDEIAVPGVTNRQMLLFKLDRFASLTTRTGHLETIGKCACSLADGLRRRFPETEPWPSEMPEPT